MKNILAYVGWLHYVKGGSDGNNVGKKMLHTFKAELFSMGTSIHGTDTRSGIMPFHKIARNPNNVPYG